MTTEIPVATKPRQSALSVLRLRNSALVLAALMAVGGALPAAADEEFRSADGSGNNLKDPAHGSAGQPLRRNLDGNFEYRSELLTTIFDVNSGATLPSADPQPNPRAISNLLTASSNPPQNDRNNLLETFFGQFVNHDKEETRANQTIFYTVPLDPSDVLYNAGPRRVIFVGLTEPRDDGAERDAANFATSWLDLSTVYGSSDAVMNGSSASERTGLRSGVGGLLKTGSYTVFADQVPIATYTNELPSLAQCTECRNDGAFIGPLANLVAAGDGRVAENVSLALMHTVYHREHNRLAGLLAEQYPNWDDEQLFQTARKLNIAQYQRTLFEEYLPEVVRGLSIPKYTGYKKNTEAATSIEFATGAFRYGHSTTAPFTLLDANLDPVSFTVQAGVFGPFPFTDDKLPFAGQLGGPFTVHVAYQLAGGSVFANGPSNIMRGLVNTPVDEPDIKINDVLRNIRAVGLFGNGVDLITSDIVRGRETGLPSYYALRKEFYQGSRKRDLYKAKTCVEGATDSIGCFLEITADTEVATNMQTIYGKVTAIDGIIGLLAEDKENDSEYLPRTAASILLDEYVRARDGDRFWYEQRSYLSAKEARILGTRTFGDIVRDNFLGVVVNSENVFVLP